MSWMDVLISVICIVNCIKGWMKGLIASAFQVVSFLIAIIVAKKYYSVVSEFLLKQPIVFEKIQNQISNRLQSVLNTQAIPGSIVAERNIFQLLKIPESMEKWLMQNKEIQVYSAKAMGGVNDLISNMLVRMIVDFLSIFLIFIAVKMILSIIGNILNRIGKHSMLKGCNRFGGLLFGFTKSLFIIFIFLGLLVPILAVTGNSVLAEGLEQSILAGYLYNHNPMIRILKIII
jgi:uncharacterized membrane protein required for colicin V production